MKNLFIIFIFALTSCSHIVRPPETIIGKAFPEVRGVSLTGEKLSFPKDTQGKNTVFLIGYRQKAQFDIDRWILGILQADISTQIVELPTIAGMMPRMVQGFINNGMRRGIPKEDWATVVNVYEDADLLIDSFGNERPQSARVVAVDAHGKILWTTDRGYSAAQILELKKLFSSLRK